MQKPVPAIVSRKVNIDKDNEPVRHVLSTALNSRYLDLIILLLVLADLACVAVESSIDLHIACIGDYPEVPMYPESLVKLAEAQESVALQQLQPPSRQPHRLMRLGASLQTVREVAAAAAASAAKGRSKRRAGFNAGEAILSASHPTDTGEDDPVAIMSLSTRHAAVLSPSLNRSAEVLAVKAAEVALEETPVLALVCQNKYGKKAEHVMHVAHMTSIAILFIFMIELCLKIFVHPYEFCTNWWEMLDLVVVSVSLTMDIFEHSFEEVWQALVVLRLWRCVRILHGVIEVMDSDKEYIETLEEELEKIQKKIDALENAKGRPTVD